jgi:hypothetical protein
MTNRLSVRRVAFSLVSALAVAASVFPLRSSAETRPLRVLLVTGGCCHDYARQKDILKKGLEERANMVVDISYSDDTTTKPPLPMLGNPDYAKGYDLVIHDECGADINDPAIVEEVLKPHRESKRPRSPGNAARLLV